MPIDNGGPAAYVPEPFHGDKREREMEKIAWKRQRSSDSGGNWRRFRSVSTFDICQIVRQGVRGIAGGALRLIREPPPPLWTMGQSPTATDIPINCITRLFRFHLFGNV